MKTTIKALVACLVCAALCSSAASAQSRAGTKQKKASCCAPGGEREAAAPLTDSSVYQLRSVWRSQDGKKVALESLRGTPRVVAMVFTRCSYACPQIVGDLKRIQALLAERRVAKGVGYVLFSIDPERDTPAALKKFAAKRSLPSPLWTLLASDESQTRELSALLGVKYKRQENGDFSHSNIITVLNAEGEIVHQQIGLNQDPTTTVDAIEKLVKKTARR